MNVFVTGGTGFIGAHLVNALLARGDQVTCLVRSPAKAASLESRGVRLVRGDLHNGAALREGCAGNEVVIHLAGVIAGRDAQEFVAANRDGTANVLDAVTRASPATLRRFVFVSSIAATGPALPGKPLDESAPLRPVTPYGESKRAGEALVQAAGVPWTIVRPPLVYGEWDRATLRIFKLASRGILPLLGDGSQELSAIHGADLADALVAAAEAERTRGRVYFAAHRETTTARHLGIEVARALGRRRMPLVVPIPAGLARVLLTVIGTTVRWSGRGSVLSAERAPEFLAPAWTCRSDALQADTGWQARIDLATGLRRTARWYREQGWLG